MTVLAIMTIIKFKILGGNRRTATKTSTLDTRRADFRLLRELVSKVSWETSFERVFFKYHLRVEVGQNCEGK